MSSDHEVLSQGFWQQSLQANTPALPTAVQYGLAPHPPRLSAVMTPGGVQEVLQPQKVGRLRQGGFASCGSLKGLCGPVDPQSGRELAWQPCSPERGDAFNCYYEGNPAPVRATAMATLSSEPFGSVMKTVYNQPSYGDAAQTFFAGKV